MPGEDQDSVKMPGQGPDPATFTQAITHTAIVEAASPADLKFSLSAGQRCGHFLVIRPLGSGGMGEVYEAEDVDSGRRVALKRLRQSLTTDRDRARFLREGRLAAAINHEHVVYVFGTEEIDGSPVITMELATGGTLKDRVNADGPLAAEQAVDAILQVIDGLEATAASGVLHRDVKPSNCFVGADGSVKVGDFGLSISTQTPLETQLSVDGAVLGTPAFAPPEQVTGQALDVRSDIYSTAATLYYLLTARAPFVGDSIVQVIGSVIRDAPDSPATVRPGLSADLAWIVQRGLAKAPSHRYQTYEAFRRALLPYSSQRLQPAPPSSRVLANLVDSLVRVAPALALGLVDQDSLIALQIYEASVTFLYFAVTEGTWGMSFGKFLLGLRVVGIDQRPIGLPQALQRSLVWTVASAVLPGGLEIAMISAWGRQRVIELLLDVGTLGLLFMSARPENGFAGLHETLTGTRVVTGAASRIRDSLRLPGWRQPPDPGAQRIGAYLVVESLGPTDGGHLLLGYDDVLRRHVWIHTQPAGTPPVTAARRLLGRPGRLRWLAGRRSATENWDAYDAPAGVAFTELVRVRQPWSLVRFLLYDVAREVTAIVSAGEEVTVGLDRLWVTSHGTAVLLDFPAPGVQASAQGSFTDLAWAQLHGLFMDMAILGVAGHPRVASVTSAAEPVPIPLHAHEFLMKLEQNELASLPAVTSALEALLPRPTIVTRRRRVVQLLAVAGMPLAALVTGSYFGLQRGLSVMGFFVLMVAVPAIWCAAMFRGGLVLRLLGITIATRRGAAVSRPYALLRAVAAWFAPLALVVGILYRLDWLVVVAFLVVAASIIAAVLTPDRGLHDRLLGTRLVRR